MSPDFYKKVTPLRQKITDLEKDILSGEISPVDETDFNRFFEVVSTTFEELKQVYRLSLNNTVFAQELDEYFQDQKNLLEYLYYFMYLLQKKHKYFEVTKEAIQEEWKDIVCILRYNQIERRLEQFKQKFFKEELLQHFNRIDTFKMDMENFINQSTSMRGEDADFLKLASFVFLENRTSCLNNSFMSQLEKEKLEKIKSTLENEVEAIFNRMQVIQKNVEHAQRIEESKSILRKEQKEYLASVSSILEPVSIRSREYTDEGRKDTEVDEDFFNQLTLTRKIRYLDLILKNIEAKKASNEKEYIKVVRNGIERKIPRRFQVRYRNISNRMEDLLLLYDKEKDAEVESVSLEVEKEIQEEKQSKNSVKGISYYQFAGIDEKEHEAYVTSQIEMNNLKREMGRLVTRAKNSLKIKEAVPIEIEDKTYLLLPEDVEKFKRYYEEYRVRKNKIATFSCGTEKEYADKEDAIYQKICSLKESGADKEKICVQLHKLRREQYRANRGKKNARFRNLLFFIQSLSIPKNLESTYLKVAFSPDSFVRSKKYSDSVKKKALGNCLRLFKKYEESPAKVSGVALTLEGMSKKIKAELEMLPKNANHVLNVKSVKKAKNTLKLKKFIDENACYFAAGFVGVLVATTAVFFGLSHQHNVVEKEMAEKYGRKFVSSSEVNQEKIDSLLSKLENKKEEKTLFDAINEVQEQGAIKKYGFSNPFSPEQNTVSQNKMVEEDSLEEKEFVDKIVERQKDDYAVMAKKEEKQESLGMPEFTRDNVITSFNDLEVDSVDNLEMNQKVLLKADTYVSGSYKELENFDENAEKKLYTGEKTVTQTGFLFKKNDGSYVWISNTDSEWEKKWEECILSGAEAIGFRGANDLVGLGFFPMDSIEEELGGQSR